MKHVKRQNIHVFYMGTYDQSSIKKTKYKTKNQRSETTGSPQEKLSLCYRCVCLWACLHIYSKLQSFALWFQMWMIALCLPHFVECIATITLIPKVKDRDPLWGCKVLDGCSKIIPRCLRGNFNGPWKNLWEHLIYHRDGYPFGAFILLLKTELQIK